MAEVKDAPAGATPAAEPAPTGSVGQVQDKYQKLKADSNPPYTENRVRTLEYNHPEGPDHGGLSLNTKGSDSKNLLVEIPSSLSTKRATQRLHRLAYERFLALNEAWKAETNKGDIKIASGWRKNPYLTKGKPDLKKYHEYCRNYPGKGSPNPAPRYLLPNQSSGGYKFGCGPVPNGASQGCKNSAVNGIPPEEWGKKCNKYKAFISPHETGLAIDFGSHGLTPNSSKEGQTNSALYKWLKDNAHRFGMTPYAAEPWHWEFRIPYEAWRDGEEFVIGDGEDKYNVRISSTGSPTSVKKSRRPKSGKPPCPPKELLSDAEVMEPEGTVVGLAQPGAKFQKLASRDFKDIKSIIIHETFGRFDMVDGPDGVPGKKSSAAIKTMLEKDSKPSTHFTISRTGEIRQHAFFGQIAKHTGDSTLDKHSIGIHLINNPLIDKDYAKELVNSSTNHSIIEAGSLFDTKHKYFLFNTPSQLEALRALILAIIKGPYPNLKEEFPCSENFVFGADDRHRQRAEKHPQGIFCRRRTGDEHFAGLFAEWYLAAAALRPPEAGRASGSGSGPTTTVSAAIAAVSAARDSAAGVSGGVNFLWGEGFLVFHAKATDSDDTVYDPKEVIERAQASDATRDYEIFETKRDIYNQINKP